MRSCKHSHREINLDLLGHADKDQVSKSFEPSYRCFYYFDMIGYVLINENDNCKQNMIF